MARLVAAALLASASCCAGTALPEISTVGAEVCTDLIDLSASLTAIEEVLADFGIDYPVDESTTFCGLLEAVLQLLDSGLTLADLTSLMIDRDALCTATFIEVYETFSSAMHNDAVEAEWATIAAGFPVPYADALAAVDSLGSTLEAAVEEGGYHTTTFFDACPQFCNPACDANAQCTDAIISMADLDSDLLELLFASVLGSGQQSGTNVSAPEYFCKKFRNVVDHVDSFLDVVIDFDCELKFDSIVDAIKGGFSLVDDSTYVPDQVE